MDVHWVSFTASKKMQKKPLGVTELPDIAINDFVAKKFAHRIRLLVVTELLVSGTQCTVEPLFNG